MDEEQVDALFARYVEQLVLHGAHLEVDELASGDAELAAALRARIQAFQKVDAALDRRLEPLTGKSLGRYQVLEKLGAGGMGEVYRAKDRDLGREVAIKVLPPLFAWDAERRTRFEREARILAALDHRNIAAIHGLERVEGQQFLVLQLVPGETLAERIGRGPVPLGEALSLSVQIVQALEAAHARGVIHRDLKPANIKVTPDGTVKVLDFGLGKMFGAPEAAGPIDSAVSTTPKGTVTGLVLGTAAYMSPEQARGERVDHRTDIFSLGVVLQELLTGTNPFKREGSTATLAAILSESPPLLSAPRRDISADTLSKLQLVLDKCLARDPAARYQETKDLIRDLDWIRGGPESRGTAKTPAPQTGKRGFLLASVATVLVAASVALTRWLRHDPVPILSNPVQVTRSIGAEAYPTWSPDGGRIAYHLNTQGDDTSYDIWVAQVTGGQVMNLTGDHPGIDRYPSWSPDGNQIVFWSDRQGGGYFVVSALGGPARRVAEHRSKQWQVTRAQWSSDGRELARVVHDQSGVVLQIESLISGASRKLPLAGTMETRFDPSWSPDGRYFAYVDSQSHVTPLTMLRVVRLEDRQTFAVTDGRTKVWSPSWSKNARYLYLASNRVGSMDLWRQRLREGRPVGDPERVTTGIGVTSAAFSPDGRRLAYSRGRPVSNVWRVPISKERPATWADAQQVTFDEAFIERLDVSPDGSHLLVASDRSGNPDLWMLPVAGGEMEQITTDPVPDSSPAWSPDGERIAFQKYRSGTRQIWVQPLPSGPARQLTTGDGEAIFPSWSPDGRNIVFSWLGKSGGLRIVPAAGGEPRRLMTDADYPRWSPDGKWLAFYSTRSGSSGPWRARANGEEPEQLAGGYPPCWSRDGRRLFYFAVGERARDIWAVRVDGREKRAMTDLRGRYGGPAGTGRPVATDGLYLYFIWQEDLGDIWVADVT